MFEHNVKNLYVGNAYALAGEFQLRTMTSYIVQEKEIAVVKVNNKDEENNMPAKYRCIDNSWFSNKTLNEVDKRDEEGITNLVCVGDYYYQSGIPKLTKRFKEENALIYAKLDRHKRFF